MIDYLVKMLCLAIGMTGIWFLFGKWVINFFASRSSAKQIRVKTRRGTATKDTARAHPWISKMEFIVEFTHKGKITFGTYCFILVVTLVFALTFLYFMNNLSFVNVFFSFGLLLFPISFTLTRYYFAKLESSYEGERLVIEFINQYRINSGNVLETINKTAMSLKEEVYSKAALNRLYFSLTSVRNSEDGEKALLEFANTIDTQWARLLSHNILSALVSGVDISESLEDILGEIKAIKTSIEKAKRENNEGYKVGVFLAPIIYVGTTYFGLKAMDMNLNQYIVAQFGSDIGYKLIIGIGIMYAASIIFSQILKRPKFD